MIATVGRDLVAGFEALVLENPRIRAVVIPSLGGRMWELVDRVRGRQWIWHRDGIGLVSLAPGSAYDDVWAGGWEELFPNDAPADFEGRTLPDHGEWWTSAWSVVEALGGTEAVVRLECKTQVRRASCIKEFRLPAEADTIHVSYRIESLEAEPFHFLFKQHLPISLSSSCRLALPGGVVTVVDPTFGTLVRTPGPFSWPFGQGADDHRVDLRVVPDKSNGQREFVYVTDLPDGWCGVEDTQAGASLLLRYNLRELPFLWLFLAYGGWRDCYTAVLEPCTNMPKDMSEAVRRGQSACLYPGEVIQVRVAVTVGGVPLVAAKPA